MGHRANFVVIRNSSAQAFYNHWGALECLSLLEGGPVVGVSAAETNAPTSELMVWCYAEGGYLIDLDKRLLVAFGTLVPVGDVEVEGEERRKAANQFLLKLAPKWPGWLLRWDDRGVDAFADHLEARAIKGIDVQEREAPPGLLALEQQA